MNRSKILPKLILLATLGILIFSFIPTVAASQGRVAERQNFIPTANYDQSLTTHVSDLNMANEPVIWDDPIQLTSNEYHDSHPQIHNGMVTWESYEIFFYDGISTQQLTDNGGTVQRPKIHNGWVTWYNAEGHWSEIFLYDGISTKQLTNNDFIDCVPQIHNGMVTWQGNYKKEEDYEIFIYDGISIQQLTNNYYYDYDPQIHNGLVVWSGWREDDFEIFLYDGISTQQLTNNEYNDESPQIHNGMVTWMGNDGNDYEIFLYDGISTQQLTNNDYDDWYPQIHNGMVTWMGNDGNDYEIFFYDGISTQQLTDNEWYDFAYNIHNGLVTWNGYDGNDNEIFFYDGISTQQLTNNEVHDWYPQIHNGMVTWMGNDSKDYEIFLIGPDVTPPKFDDVVTTPPTVNNRVVYEQGTIGHSITWIPSEANPDGYSITLNGIDIESGGWSGNNISIGIDGLTVGRYAYVCTVDDLAGFSSSNTVLVLVYFEHEHFRFGTLGGPTNLDPHNAFDYNSYDVIDQVIETLFACDLSDPELNIIPRLALDYGIWSNDGLKYRIPLRSGITFHDGTSFNAETVKWNFDRLNYFLNLDPSFNPETRSPLYPVYLWPDGTPRIQNINIISEYIIEFVLSRPYTALEALLSFQGSGIMSPTSTHPYEDIDTLSGDLIGTGPFVYDEYIENSEVRFHAYEDYWQGSSYIDILYFNIYPNADELTQALLNSEVDFIKNPSFTMLQELRDHPGIILVEDGQSATTRYLGINNQQVPWFMRKAISYALQYDEIIYQLTPNAEAERLRSPLPLGIKHANWEFDIPEYDVITAREAIIASGVYDLLPPADDDNAWQLREQNNPLEVYTYVYWTGSEMHVALYDILNENLKNIGVRVLGYGLNSIEEWFNQISEQQLFTFGWAPDINDPSNYIYNLFGVGGNEYDYNAAQVYDVPTLQLMDQALSETDPSARRDLYYNIQQMLIEDVYPMCWLWVLNNYDAFYNTFSGFHMNAMEKVWFYSVLPSFLDVTPPTWNPIPSDQVVELGDEFSYIITAIDESSVSHLWIDDTENFIWDPVFPYWENNFLIRSTHRLAAGEYSLEIRAYDPYENYCSATITIWVQDTTPPTTGHIPNQISCTYTRVSQVIYSLTVYDRSEISYVYHLASKDLPNFPIPLPTSDCFSIELIHLGQNPHTDLYYTTILIKTTGRLPNSIGIHDFRLVCYDSAGNYINNRFEVRVRRLASLKLSGEHDYIDFAIL
jgi:ABC-type transport system substrate-binding protein